MSRGDEDLTNLQQEDRPMAERSGSVVRNLDEGSVKFNRARSDARDLVRGLGRPEGSLGRLLGDPTLYNNLNETLCAINRMMPTVDRILRNVEVFADKIARHPEALGVRGAVSPSSGLKEA